MLISASDGLNQTVENLNDVVDIRMKSTDNYKRLNLLEYINKVTKDISAQIKQSRVQVEIEVVNSLFIAGIPSYLESIF